MKPTAKLRPELVARALRGWSLTQHQVNVLLRACITASPGNTLVAADYSQVEARALAWAAHDYEAIEVFRSGADPYMRLACRLFGIDPARFSKKQHAQPRDTAKKAELGCFGAETLVLTAEGWRPIVEINDDDRLWDGVEWVKHAGVVPRGLRHTVRRARVAATPDHPVLCGSRWREFTQAALDGDTPSIALATGWEALLSSDTAWAVAAGSWPSWFNATAGLRRTALIHTACDGVRPPPATDARNARPQSTGVGTLVTLRSALMTLTESACSIASQLLCSGATRLAAHNTETTARVGSTSGLGGASHEPSAGSFFGTCSRFAAGTIRRWSSIGKTTKEDTNPGTSASSPKQSTRVTAELSETCSAESTTWRPVYDIAHAGPRNRFMVLTSEGPILVHNCGYGMGAPKFTITAEKGGMVWNAPELCPGRGEQCDDPVCGAIAWTRARGRNPAQPYTHGAQTIVNVWRETHAPIVDFWDELKWAAITATQGERCSAGPYEWARVDGATWCMLPSGRPLVYNGMRVENKDLTYQDPATGFEKRTYGGSLSENVTQAFCRDLLARALVGAEDAGLCPVLHVHDEIVCDVPKEMGADALELLELIMGDLPPWAEGFPMKVEGFVSERYRK